MGSRQLVKILTDNATPTLNWMIDEGGLKLREVVNRTGCHSNYRTHTCVEGVGRGYTESLKKIAEKRGANTGAEHFDHLDLARERTSRTARCWAWKSSAARRP